MKRLYFLVYLILQLITAVCCHPQCLDYLPPFNPSHPSFCARHYSQLSCCTQKQEKQLAIKFWMKMLERNKIERSLCRTYIQDALCTECSPFSAHIFDAEGVSSAQRSPGLCPRFCTSLFAYNCTDIILELFGIEKRVFSDAEDFCKEFSISDSDYCYPKVLGQSANVTSGTKTPEEGVQRDDCVCVREIVSGLRNPIALVPAYDRTHRMFVAEQVGVVHVILQNGTMLSEPFLDISARVLVSSHPGDERGFLGIAFHPMFRRNGRVYVYYSAYYSEAQRDEYNRLTRHVSRLSQFTISANDPNKLNETSELIILEVPEPNSNHNGGTLFFDLDNYLYLGLGDGGGAGDKFGSIGNGQNTTNIHGTMIRVDVDNPSTRRVGDKYGIPISNPFVSSGYREVRHEIFAYGFRNIWRCSMDRGDFNTHEGQGRIFCGDVGQGRYEEVDLVKKGKNYGWRVMEGNACFKDCHLQTDEFEAPILVYPHSEGKSVIGGKVYRGCLFPRLRGKYIFGDYTSGTLFYGIENESTGHWSKEAICFAADSSCKGGGTSNSYKSGILSFGESESGEIFFLSTSNPSSQAAVGSVYQLVDPSTRQECSFKTLSHSLPTSNWDYASVCKGCGANSLTSNNVCDVTSDFIMVVNFISRGKDPFTSAVIWRVRINNILLLRRDTFWFVNIKDIINLIESRSSVFCRCVSSKVIDIDTETPDMETSFIVSGRVKGASLYLYRGSLILESSADRENVLDKDLGKCFN